MSSFIRLRLLATLGTVGVLTAATAFAQNDNQRQKVNDKNDPSRPAATERGERGANQSSSTDGMFAHCLIVDNQNEVALGQFAQQRTQNAEVKKFAQQMVQDHGAFIKKLQSVAGTSATRTSTSGTRTESREGQPGREGQAAREGQPGRDQALNQVEQATPRTPAVNPPSGTNQQATNRSNQPGSAGGSVDFISLKNELGEKCLQTAKRELEEKNGAEFDKCYIHMQVGMHLGAIDAMQVFQNHCSSELRQVLAEGIQTAQGHLQHAKELAKKLDTGTAAETARREKAGD